MSDSVLTYQRTIPVRYHPDVLVAGGGPAGVAAAITAAEQGCQVMLVEATQCLGGMGTSGLVPAFMQFTDGMRFLAVGVGQRILEALRREGGTCPPDGFGIRVEVLKRLYDSLLQQAGVMFLFQTQVLDANMDGRQLTHAVCAGKSGLFAVAAQIFIDATGDGDLAVRAGAEYQQGDETGRTQPATLCSLWAGIDWPTVWSSGLGTGDSQIDEAIRDGILSVPDRHLPGMWPVGETVGGGNIGHAFGVDGCDEASLTPALVAARLALLEYERYYKRYLKGFERMELVCTAPSLGIRETRRILGDYVLCLDDFLNRASFPDEIGRYAYPIDRHAAEPGTASYQAFWDDYQRLRYQLGESYGIPYRILTPRGLDNLLVCGRCVSTDLAMQASIRVMPGCYITGQAAGAAAALAVRSNTNTRGVSIEALQHITGVI